MMGVPLREVLAVLAGAAIGIITLPLLCYILGLMGVIR